MRCFTRFCRFLQNIYLKCLFQSIAVVCSITPIGEFVKMIEAQVDSVAADNLENLYCGNYKIHV